MKNIYRIKYQSKLYELPYEIIYSRRRTCAISILAEGKIILRLPFGTSEAQIKRLLSDKQHWIITHYLEAVSRSENRPASDLTDTQRAALEKRYIDAAREYFRNAPPISFRSQEGFSTASPSAIRRPAGEAAAREAPSPSTGGLCWRRLRFLTTWSCMSFAI